MKRNYLEYQISQEEDGREVKTLLFRELNLTAKKIRSVKFHECGILLDGQRVTVREKVRAGQILAVLLDDVEDKEQAIIPNPMELDIIYEDDYYLFLNKPTGLCCHPAQGHLVDTLANGVRAYFDGKDTMDRIHLVGRLDKDTSGIVVVAKNSVAAERLVFDKTYYALVEGKVTPEKGYIGIAMEESYEGEDNRILKMKRATGENGKEAGTHYALEREFDTFSLCALRLDTGRTHQIRFHMSEMGWPLIGDSIYGNGATGQMSRTALHAGMVDFTHPFTGQDIHLVAPIPPDMLQMMEQHRI